MAPPPPPTAASVFAGESVRIARESAVGTLFCIALVLERVVGRRSSVIGADGVVDMVELSCTTESAAQHTITFVVVACKHTPVVCVCLCAFL